MSFTGSTTKYFELSNHSIFNLFDGSAYINEYYSELDYENRNLANFELDILGNLGGFGNVIEFGNGGVLSRIVAISIMHLFNDDISELNIFASDYSKSSRDELNNWINNSSLGHNWDKFILDIYNLILNRFNYYPRFDLEYIKNSIKTNIKGSFYCNMYNKEPMGKHFTRYGDLLLIGFVHESAIPYFDQYHNLINYRTRLNLWESSMRNTLSLLKKNGTVIIEALTNSSQSYQVGYMDFPVLDIKSAYIIDFLSKNGFKKKNINLKSFQADPNKVRGYKELTCISATNFEV